MKGKKTGVILGYIVMLIQNLSSFLLTPIMISVFGDGEFGIHFRGHNNYEWSELVPRFYSVETIWADSALAAIKDLDKSEMFKKFNVVALAACLLKKYPQFKDIIIQHYNNCSQTTDRSKAKIVVAYLKYPTLDLIKRAIRRIRRRRDDFFRVNGIENIIKASEALQLRFLDIGIDTKMIIASLDSV